MSIIGILATGFIVAMLVGISYLSVASLLQNGKEEWGLSIAVMMSILVAILVVAELIERGLL